MGRIKGENTRAFIVRGDAETRLVPFVFEGVTCRVPAGVLRHHPARPDCPVLEEALSAPNSWKEKVETGRELRSRTVRCTGGCWAAYEATEQRRIASGDEAALRDWNEDGLRARAALVRRVLDGLVPGEQVDS